MDSDANKLPHDPAELQHLVRSLLSQNDSLVSANEQLAAKNDQLENRVDRLESELRLHRVKRFKAQSEKARTLLGDIEQGDIFPEALTQVLKELGIEAEDEPPAPAIQVPAHTRRPRKPRTLDASLPRVEVIHELQNTQCDRCGETMVCIGAEPPLEQLAIIPAKQFVIRHIRKKYACQCKQCIKRAEMPRQPIPKSQASPQLLAFLMVSKFLDGLPLYRLEKILGRYGMELTRHGLAR